MTAPSGVTTTLLWDLYLFEQTVPAGSFNTGAGGEFVVPTGFGGIFEVTLNLLMSGTVPGSPLTLATGATSNVAVNGTIKIQNACPLGYTGVASFPRWITTGLVVANDGDIITSSVFQDSGAVAAMVGGASGGDTSASYFHLNKVI